MIKKLNLKEYQKELIEELKANNPNKGKGILVFHNPDDAECNSYIKTLQKIADQIDVKIILLNYFKDTSIMRKCLISHNKCDSIKGILFMNPCPPEIFKLRNYITRDKDIDCIGSINRNYIYEHKDNSVLPCTSKAIIKIIDRYYGSLDGKIVTVIGRSNTVTNPVARACLNNNATVIQCHTHTPLIELDKICESSDVIITATGHYGTINNVCSYKNNAFIVDAGFSVSNDKIHGDVDIVYPKYNNRNNQWENFENITITAVPGGVGLITPVMCFM